MKKSLKMFYTSFTLSSFAIWVANEMFLSVSPVSNQKVELPKQNIALFFQKQDSIPQSLKVKKIASSGLPVLYQPEDVEEDFDVDSVLNMDTPESPAIKISSVEDVADIPLEYAVSTPDFEETAHEQVSESVPQPANFDETIQKTATAVSVKLVEPSENTQASGTDVDNKPQNESEEKPMIVAVNTADADLTQASDLTGNEDIIPIENGSEELFGDKLEIVSQAPQNQTAMADNHISVDTLAVEADKIEDLPKPREWHAMSESEDSPWVVAKANQYARNAQIAEDFAGEMSEEEIENLLYPEKTEGGEVVQTAEIAKNILIPIPEDIMNDENLTPQLVSPKKSFSENREDDGSEDEQSAADEDKSGKKKSFLQKLTSLFGDSSEEDGVDDKNSDEDSDSGMSEGKGKFSAFRKGKNKTIAKILPAEMRLSFQPGRAEISGQTLRWIQAFANKAAEDSDTVLEIRIDKNSSYALQQRRLELLHTILDARGIGEDKVNTVFTSREPNSFIIRTLRISENSSNRTYKNKQEGSSNYQTW